MMIDKNELLMLQKLGFEVKDGRIVEAKENPSVDELKYAGFNIYISDDNRIFEKQGEELVEKTSPELEAERRFLQSSCS